MSAQTKVALAQAQALVQAQALDRVLGRDLVLEVVLILEAVQEVATDRALAVRVQGKIAKARIAK